MIFFTEYLNREKSLFHPQQNQKSLEIKTKTPLGYTTTT